MTKFPFTDLARQDEPGISDGLLNRYTPNQMPKIFYTNTSVEYWGLGRAAALTHISHDTIKDLVLPENVRIYLLAGTPLPYFVPQVDADGNEISGIRVPDLSVPLATMTGWNFRANTIGNAGEIVALLGSYIPFAVTRIEREAVQDTRPSVGERYPDRGEYLQKICAAATELIMNRYLLLDDMEEVLARANAHWEYANSNR